MDNKINYKLIFSDLDETLLVNNHIPQFNLEAIKKSREKDVKLVFCSGRNYQYMLHLLKGLNTENEEGEYTVCCSGSIIYENKNKKLIYFKGIDNNIFNYLFGCGKKLNKDIFMLIYTLEGAYVYNEELTDKNDWKGFEYKVT